MKIVDISEFYSEQGGGVRTYVNQKLEASASEGCETVIIAPNGEDRVEHRPGGKIIWVKAPRHPLDPRYHVFWGRQAVHQVLDEEAPQIVEGSSPWRGGWLAASWRGDAVKSFFVHQDPIAVYPHTILGGMFGAAKIDQMCGVFWAYLRKLSALFDTSIVSGEWLADRLESFGLERPFAVPFGVDKDLFSPDYRNEATRRAMLAECGVTDENATLLVAVSRHHPEKRIGTLINAYTELRQRRPIGLYIIGDGPTRMLVERKAAKAPGVKIAGAIRDRNELATKLASADAMLHGGAAETYGLVIAEALCSGLPLSCSQSGRGGRFGGTGLCGNLHAGRCAGLRRGR